MPSCRPLTSAGTSWPRPRACAWWRWPTPAGAIAARRSACWRRWRPKRPRVCNASSTRPTGSGALARERGPPHGGWPPRGERAFGLLLLGRRDAAGDGLGVDELDGVARLDRRQLLAHLGIVDGEGAPVSLGTLDGELVLLGIDGEDLRRGLHLA